MPARRKSITRKELHRLVWSKPMTAAAAECGRSPNGLAKMCDRWEIPYPGRGHWTKPPAQRPAPAPLEPMPAWDRTKIAFDDPRAGSHRQRTRMSPAQRRQQILDRALAIVRDEGLGAVSMKRIAREVAISEALAFKYFSTRAELLAALTRQELAAMAEYQEREIAQGESARSRIAHSTRAYFQQIEERGSVLHALLASSEVRILLRGENQARRARRGGEVGRAFAARYGVKPDLALAAVNTMTAATRRAGRWIALKKVTRQEVEPIVITMVEAVNRALVRP